MARRRRAWRWAMIPAIYLAIGLVVTVLVAWYFAQWGSVSTLLGTPDARRHRAAIGMRMPASLSTIDSQWVGFGIAQYTSVWRGPSDPVIWAHVQAGETGAPWLAMRWRAVDVHGVQGVRTLGAVEGGVFPSRGRPWMMTAVFPPPLPMLPIFPGFLLDVMLFAGIAALPHIVLVTLRCLLRSRLNCCAACGYDLAGLSAGAGGAVVCPECGAAEAAS